MGLDLVFAIEKENLNRKMWEEGLQMLNKTGIWNEYSDHVITSSTFLKLPTTLNKYLSSHSEEHDRTPFDVYHRGRVFRCGVIPLYDAANVEVGDVFAFADYTSVISNRNLFLFFASFCFILAVISWYFLSAYFNRLEQELHMSISRVDHLISKQENNMRASEDSPGPSATSEQG